MKIVHVIGSVDPARGGVPAVATRLAAGQAALGHSVSIVSHDEPIGLPRIRQAQADVPGLERVRMHLLPQLPRPDILGWTVRRPLTRVLAGADAVHLHGVWEPILRQAASVARLAGIAYCVAPSGMLDVWSLGQKRWKKRLALALGYRRMLDRADFIHVLNDDEAEMLSPLRLRAPGRIIPNGVFLQEVEPLPSKEALQKDYPALAGRRYVLFLSRLHWKKGLDVLADAFSRLAPDWPDVDLVVAGPEGGAGNAFRLAVAEKGLTKRVHMVGGLYGRDKIAALVGAECFCLPSRQEGFSVAITEALACAVPVVISRQCHFPEVAACGAGHVVELDAAVVADAISTVLADPVEARRMGEAGRALVEERFTWPKIAKTSLEAYRPVQPACA